MCTQTRPIKQILIYQGGYEWYVTRECFQCLSRRHFTEELIKPSFCFFVCQVLVVVMSHRGLPTVHKLSRHTSIFSHREKQISKRQQQRKRMAAARTATSSSPPSHLQWAPFHGVWSETGSLGVQVAELLVVGQLVQIKGVYSVMQKPCRSRSQNCSACRSNFMIPR